MSGSTADPVTGLTPRQEAFCVALVKHGNATQAYRDAYPKQKMNPNSLAVAASQLQARPKVAIRLTSLRGEARTNSGITLVEHLKALGALRNLASTAKQYGPAVSAEVARGKVSGLYDGTDDDSDTPAPTVVNINIVNGRKTA
jgi:hypothetical protein